LEQTPLDLPESKKERILNSYQSVLVSIELLRNELESSNLEMNRRLLRKQANSALQMAKDFASVLLTLDDGEFNLLLTPKSKEN
jgi:hypothetical protein